MARRRKLRLHTVVIFYHSEVFLKGSLLQLSACANEARTKQKHCELPVEPAFVHNQHTYD